MSPRKKATVEEAARTVRTLRQSKASAAQIAADLSAARPDLGNIGAGEPAPGALPDPVDPLATAGSLRSGLRDVKERIMASEDAMRGVVNDAARSMHQQTGVLRAEIERLQDGVAALSNQVAMFAQILQQLDVGRLDRAVQSLDEARARAANPPVQESIRAAAAAIEAGERLPRAKIGVTVDGQLYAAMKAIQAATGRNMSRCLDEALRSWIDQRPGPSDVSETDLP